MPGAQHDDGLGEAELELAGDGVAATGERLATVFGDAKRPNQLFWFHPQAFAQQCDRVEVHCLAVLGSFNPVDCRGGQASQVREVTHLEAENLTSLL